MADAVVLGTWSATGASKALANGLGVMPALLLGCLTAVGGSMIRDVSVGETPAVFGGNKLYAIPALCAAGTDVALVSAGLAEAWAMLASALVGAGTCLVAYWRSWRLPVSADVERERARRRRERAAAGWLRRGGGTPTTASASALVRGAGIAAGWRRALMVLPRRASRRPLRRREPLDPADM